MVTQILASIFLLGVCIFFHELGHFLMGKLVGVQPKIFSIGYGRGLFFKKVGRTLYQVTKFPIGGYVQFYGDDITKSHENVRKGHFFAAGPWRRMLIAFGGPLFSVLFGFFIIFMLIVSGWQPTSNKINVIEKSPALQAGLKDGDKIIEVNGEPTNSFEVINYYIALSPEQTIKIKVKRGSEIKDLSVEAMRREPGGPMAIGVRPVGELFLVVQKNIILGESFFRENDKIMEVNNVRVQHIDQLRSVLNKNSGKTVVVKVERKSGNLFQPSKEETLNLKVPVMEREIIHLINVTDVQTGKTVPQLQLGSWEEGAFQNIYIDGKNFTTWRDLVSKLQSFGNKKINMRIGAVHVQASFALKKRGMLGVSLASGIDPEKAQHATDLASIVTRTYEDTLFATKSTLVGLYRIIQGKISFSKSVSGPVRIMKIAADSVSFGWEAYWRLMATISIILGIMNLLPIPVLDGGHILFYLIEGVYKPLPVKAIAASVRTGLVILMTLGVYVIGLDLWHIFFKKLFGND